MTNSDRGDPAATPARCPICRRPAAAAWRPFCSKRCADIDLGRWFGEQYRVPAADGGDTDDDGDRPAAEDEGGDRR